MGDSINRVTSVTKSLQNQLSNYIPENKKLNEFFAKANKTIQDAFIEPPRDEKEFKNRIKVLKNIRANAQKVYANHEKIIRKGEGRVDKKYLRATKKQYNKLIAELDRIIPYAKDTHPIMMAHKEYSLPVVGPFINLVNQGGKYTKSKLQLRIKVKKLSRLNKEPEKNEEKIKHLQTQIDRLLEKLNRMRDNVVLHSIQSGKVVVSTSSDAIKVSQRFVGGLGAAAGSVGVGIGALGIIINSKLLYNNRKKAMKIDQHLNLIDKNLQESNDPIKMIMEMRRKNLELQKKDNLVNTIINSASMVSSVIGTTAGALAIAAIAVAGLAAIGGSLGYAALAIGAAALAIGAIYLVYKKRKVISLFLRQKAIQLKMKFSNEKGLEERVKKLQTSLDNEKISVKLNGVSKKDVRLFRQELAKKLDDAEARNTIFQFLLAEGAIQSEDLEQNVMKYILSRVK